MQRLTGMDATFLYLETPTAPMHVSGVYVYDPSTAPHEFGFESIKGEIERRLDLVPPYRQRLMEIPFQLHHPLWIEDPDFHLEHHLHRVALPAPGGRAELARLAADIHARPMDRSKPLWEFWYIEGLEDGHVALLGKTHHAAIDGASGVDISVNLLDTEPTPREIEPPETPWVPDRVPSDPELVGFALASLARQPISAFKAVRRTMGVALNLRRRNRRPDVDPPPAPFTAPRTSINDPVTPHRSFGVADVSLDDVKTIRKVFGGTVNDVVLALCAGALRSYLDRRDEDPGKSMVAMCPVSVRTEDHKGSMGNKVSAMLTRLATDVDDPVERLRAIQGGTRNAKEQAGAVGADTLANWAEFAAPAVAAQAARLYSRMKVASRLRPLFNLVISNVPGPQFPLYFNGAKLVAWYPMGPVADMSGLNMTVMSYLGTIHFGLVACSETIDDVQSIADGVCDALDELLKAAEAEAGVS
jgi:diacylglycerol O-acyltransferase / wax synthase